MDYRDYIGRPVQSLPTPAMLLDVSVLDQNIKLLADYFSSRPCKLRPHFKSHKCVTLAKRQLHAGGAVGITCAKLSEAEALVAGGIKDVLVANQVVGSDKAQRLAALNRSAMVRSAVDSETNVMELGAAAQGAGVTIGVLVEVDIGMRRCGVATGEPAVALATLVSKTRGLRLDGLQGYEGHLVMTPDAEERRRKVVEALAPMVETRHLFESRGLRCPIVSGGGTGTYDITGNVPGIDEVQAGSYAMMDCHYKKIRSEFQNAMSILATVISVTGRKVVLDVGLKGVGSEFGLPAVANAPEAKALYLAEEHCPVDNCTGRVGEKLRLIPSHGCTTSNLHRRLWIIRNKMVEDVWAIEGSGCLE